MKAPRFRDPVPSYSNYFAQRYFHYNRQLSYRYNELNSVRILSWFKCEGLTFKMTWSSGKVIKFSQIPCILQQYGFLWIQPWWISTLSCHKRQPTRWRFVLFSKHTFTSHPMIGDLIFSLFTSLSARLVCIFIFTQYVTNITLSS